MTELRTFDTIKMIRETLALAQSAIHFRAAAGHDADQSARHVRLLGRLIADCDRQRPLGPDGRHGDGERCTPTCGCAPANPGPPEGFLNWWTEGGPEALLQEAITHVDVTDLRGVIGNKIKHELLNGLWWLTGKPLWSDVDWVEVNLPRHTFEVGWGELAREVLARPTLPIKDLLATHVHTEEECAHRVGAHETPGVSTCSDCGDHYANTPRCPQRCEVTYHEIITSVVDAEYAGDLPTHANESAPEESKVEDSSHGYTGWRPTGVRVWHETRVLVYPGPSRDHTGSAGRNHGVGRIMWLRRNVDPTKSEYGVRMEKPYGGTSTVRHGDFEILPETPDLGD